MLYTKALQNTARRLRAHALLRCALCTRASTTCNSYPFGLLPAGSASTRSSMAHATYASFSSKGDRLVACYHGDHAYAFDVTAAGCVSAAYPLPVAVRPLAAGGWGAGGG